MDFNFVTPELKRKCAYPGQGGFALLVTIVLVAFLVLILVGLAAFTRVETQVASNTQAMAQARQNALMGLNVAVGQLQKHAGRDTRITAQGSLKGASVANPWFTGVWDADDSDSPNALTWLVSGNEVSALAVTETTNLQRTSSAPEQSLSSANSPGRVLLVGESSTRTSALPAVGLEHGAVAVPAVALEAVVPGISSANVVVGRYAWWAGDEGVKASLVLPDRVDEVTYAPWTTVTQRNRIRQQIGSAPSYFRGNSASSGLSGVRLEGFDPFQNNGEVGKVMAPAQLAQLSPAGMDVSISDFRKDRFHELTTAAYSVLANTLPSSNPDRGLLRDLSTKPDMLGSAFAKYADYESYMEAPGSTTSGAPAAIPEIADVDSPRRRYVTQPTQSNAAPGLPEIEFGVAPILSNFIVQFQVRRVNATNPALQIRSRVYVTMWNPYSTALVPPANLRLEVSGLPTIQVSDPDDTTGSSAAVNLQSTAPHFASDLELPFSKAARYSGSTSYGADGELASWLPGRVYSWTTASGTAAGQVLGFYNNTFGPAGWTHNAPAPPNGSNLSLAVSIPDTVMEVKVKLGTSVIATYVAKFESDAVPNSNVSDEDDSADYWCFGFAFRINQPRTYNNDRSWVTARDPRGTIFEQADPDDVGALIPFNTKTNDSSRPSLYTKNIATTDTVGGSDLLNGNLIYRVQGQNARAMSTYNDTSLFELPRLPLLSLGELQHLRIKDRRAYAIGNSWGGNANTVYDRFFMSGLPAGGSGVLPAIESGQPLPNWNLKPVGINSSVDLVPANPDETARHLLQAGGFNINSVSVAAWRSVLSSVRFSSSAPFGAADIVNTSNNSTANAGTQNGSATRSFDFASDTSLGNHSAPVFFRFPQTAQEVFFWGDPTPASGTSGNARKFSVSAFRQGVRGFYSSSPSISGEAGTFDNGSTNAVIGNARQHMTTDQVEVLASEIVKNIRVRAASKGPFRSMEEFLSETSVFGGVSLLEKAIDDSGMNAAEVKPVATVQNPLLHSGLSALTLTQADVLTALAPYLRTRSDTFLVRAYGEYINPVTQEPAGKAWAEATVQRFPETVDAVDSILQPDTAGTALGRRFKITSFRWLNASDI